MLEFDRITQPELELYTLINLFSGEEYTVTLSDMRSTIYSEGEILKMLSGRHHDFMLVKLTDKLDFPDAGVATNFRT